MKRVFIPIIILLAIACAYIGFQWRTTYLELQVKQNQIQSLTQEINAQKLEISQLNDLINRQNQQITSLQGDFLQASKQADEALRLLDEALGFIEEVKFTFYYASQAKQRYGVYDLEEYLNRWQWIEGTYKANEFDCSEMAAYLEWRLENEGYHAVIVAGASPSGDGSHAWLLVETSQGKYMPVESTTYSIVYWENPYFDNYFDYVLRYETIQEALAQGPEAFDWWN